MAVTFGGLATGMDTNSIVAALMKIERQPIDRLNKEKAFNTNRQKAFTDLNAKLQDLQTKAEAIDTSKELNSPTAKSGTQNLFTTSVTNGASLGSYQVKVIELAHQQKDVSGGYVDKTAAALGTGAMTLTVAGVPTNITIDATNNSLDGLATAINSANLGVSASIINDGTATPYRLVLSGDTVANAFSLDTLALAGGTYANPTMTNTQIATQAHIQVDNIDIYSDTNSFTGAIGGVTLDVLNKDPLVSNTLTVSSDEAATKQKVHDFADSYNGVIKFIAAQSDADWGNDASFRAVKRRLQGLLTTVQTGGSGSFSSLSSLGFETQRDGTVLVNDVTLSAAMTKDFAGVVSLIAGETGVVGASTTFANYLRAMTDSIDGLAATRQKSTASSAIRIDRQIGLKEARLVSREKSLRAQFTAMENLVSGMNAQSSFLTQQLSNLSRM